MKYGRILLYLSLVLFCAFILSVLFSFTNIISIGLLVCSAGCVLSRNILHTIKQKEHKAINIVTTVLFACFILTVFIMGFDIKTMPNVELFLVIILIVFIVLVAINVYDLVKWLNNKWKKKNQTSKE